MDDQALFSRIRYWRLSSGEKERKRGVSRTPRSGVLGVVLEAKIFFCKQLRK